VAQLARVATHEPYVCVSGSLNEVSSALPLPFVPSYVVNTSVSPDPVPVIDEGGPFTVQPVLQVALLTFEVAGFPSLSPERCR
jgi:hypothetical protein